MYSAPPSYVPLLQLFFWVFWAALSLKLPHLSFLNQTELMSSEPFCFCICSQAVTLRHPVQYDCEAAINELPFSPGPTPFRTVPPANVFKLPITKGSGICRLSESLVNGPTEVETSWPEVGAKAGQMNQVCVASTSALAQVRGGSIHTAEIN